MNGAQDFQILNFLDIKHNNIQGLIGTPRLSSLVTLDLSFNKIMGLRGIESIINLENIYLEGNFIEKIESLSSHASLKILNLKQNKVFSLDTLRKGLSPTITTLYLDRNPIKEIRNIIYFRPFIYLENLSFIGCPVYERLISLK